MDFHYPMPCAGLQPKRGMATIVIYFMIFVLGAPLDIPFYCVRLMETYISSEKVPTGVTIGYIQRHVPRRWLCWHRPAVMDSGLPGSSIARNKPEWPMIFHPPSRADFAEQGRPGQSQHRKANRRKTSRFRCPCMIMQVL